MPAPTQDTWGACTSTWEHSVLSSVNASVPFTFHMLAHKEYLRPDSECRAPSNICKFGLCLLFSFHQFCPQSCCDNHAPIFQGSFQAGYNKRERVTRKINSNNDGPLDVSLLSISASPCKSKVSSQDASWCLAEFSSDAISSTAKDD